jgi:hypothetical protein
MKIGRDDSIESPAKMPRLSQEFWGKDVREWGRW